MFAFSELPVSVTSTMASASIGGFTSVAPQLNSTFTFTPFSRKVSLRHLDQFRRDDLSLKIFCPLKAARLRHREHPAHLAAALLCIGQLVTLVTSSPLSTTQSIPVSPASSTPCST